jgi:hypothetical protein
MQHLTVSPPQRGISRRLAQGRWGHRQNSGKRRVWEVGDAVIGGFLEAIEKMADDKITGPTKALQAVGSLKDVPGALQ